jgi:hypothetical protein
MTASTVIMIDRATDSFRTVLLLLWGEMTENRRGGLSASAAHEKQQRHSGG